MKRKITALGFSVLLLLGSTSVNAKDDIHCLLGYWTTTSWPAAPRPYCAMTLPPGNCVVCYLSIDVE